MNIKYIAIVFLLFSNNSIFAEEYTSIQFGNINVRYPAVSDEAENENSEDQIPDGKPLENGRLTSKFGSRKDPFTGKQKNHSGIDIAADKGTEVKASAAGEVTIAGSYGKYGKLVEIDHGNEYITRYGHNSEILVQVGDKVEKGDTISLVGSTVYSN